jgi:regulator of replication initiation timing
MELNPQVIIDEMMKKINSLMTENIILSSQVKTLSEKLSGYSEASPSQVMQETIDSEGKYEEAIKEGRIGSGI